MEKQDRYCQNCGTKLKEGKCPKCLTINKKANNTLALLGFIFSLTGILSLPGLVLSIIGLNTQKKYKNNRYGLAVAGIVISSVLIFLFFISLVTNSYSYEEPKNNVEIEEAEEEEEKYSKVKVIDFSNLSKEEAEKWCQDNSIICYQTEEYNDSVEIGKLISQSVEKEKEIYEGTSIDLVYSKGHKKTPEEIESEYKSQCKELDYRDSLRNPSGHSGEKVHMFGKVSQVIGSSSYMIYMNCEENRYAASGYICNDPVYVTYYGSINLIEDDIVEVWGSMNSTAHTYTTVMGATKTVPQLNASYVIVR